MRNSLLSLLALVSMLAPSPGWAAPWVSFQSQDGKFAIQMPAQPAEDTETTPSIVGNVVDSTFSATSGDESFSVTYTDLPALAVAFGGSETIYNNAAGSLLKDVLGKQSSLSAATVAGQSGMELDYTAPARAGEPAMVGKAWMLLVGNRLYVVNATVPATGSEADMSTFFSSFRLLK